MCGIWGTVQSKPIDATASKEYYEAFKSIQMRGPDKSVYQEVSTPVNMIVGFHRLGIMGPDARGDQPFIIENDKRTVYVTCNGEIYGYKKLIEKYGLQNSMRSHSDCEVIPYIYWKYGIDTLMKDMNEQASIFSLGITSEFALIIIDVNKGTGVTNLFLARDPCGVRPLFYYHDTDKVVWSSLLKGFVIKKDNVVSPISGVTNCSSVKQLQGGTYVQFVIEKNTPVKLVNSNTYFSFDFPSINRTDDFINMYSSTYFQTLCDTIKNQLVQSVILMTESDRPIGALLSGGLDSSLVVSIASSHLKKFNKKLNTFSIGMPGSTDKMWAEKVANYCGTNHTHIELTNEQFINAIPDVIKTIESYDITTIRASTGQYLVSKWVSENTQIKVLLVGDGSDELTAGYKYFHKSPSPKDMHNENCRLLQEISYFDVLRVDRCVANFGLEARVPFLSPSFIQIYLETPSIYRTPKNGVEKWLLRRSFEGWLPEDVLYRSKEAFSDGVSSEKQSWNDLLKHKLDELYTFYTFQTKNNYIHCKPPTKEALYYRELFTQQFSNNFDHIIPHFWLPKWCGNVVDPSARVLSVYKNHE